MSYAIVRLDNVAATNNPALIRSVRYYVGETATAIENGHLVALSGLISSEREIFKAVQPTADSTVLLTCGVELLYDESEYHGLEDYRNAAGKEFRAIQLQSGDIFSVTSEGFDSTPEVGNYVTVGSDTDMIIKSSVTSETVLGTIIAIDTVGSDTYYVVLVS